MKRQQEPASQPKEASDHPPPPRDGRGNGTRCICIIAAPVPSLLPFVPDPVIPCLVVWRYRRTSHLHENTPSIFDTATILVLIFLLCSPILRVVLCTARFICILGIIIITSAIIFVFFDDDIASSPPSSSQKYSAAAAAAAAADINDP
jgi:hypothetical protein